MEQRERVLIVSVQTTQTDEDFAYANQELAQLVDTAMGEVVATVTQKRESISGRTLVGKGKVLFEGFYLCFRYSRPLMMSVPVGNFLSAYPQIP